MNKLAIIGVGLVAVVTMGGGMLLTGSASASSNTDVRTVQMGAVPAAESAQQCVLADSATETAPEGAVAIAAERVGEPIASFEMDPGSTWQSVSVDATGNITTDQGTDADMPTDSDAGASQSFSAVAVASDGSGMVSIPVGDIQLGVTCNP